MYCPVCMNNTLNFSASGVVHVILNDKQMDAGRFYYNLDNIDDPHFLEELTKKLEEFFRWYSNFQNKEAITKIQLCTSDVVCEEKCNVPMANRFSILDVLVSRKKIETILEKLSKKYSIQVHLGPKTSS